mgnify:CR=1 FL=1
MTIEIDGDVSPRAGDVLRANDFPDRAAGVGDDLGEVLGESAAADDRRHNKMMRRRTVSTTSVKIETTPPASRGTSPSAA